MTTIARGWYSLTCRLLGAPQPVSKPERRQREAGKFHSSVVLFFITPTVFRITRSALILTNTALRKDTTTKSANWHFWLSFELFWSFRLFGWNGCVDANQLRAAASFDTEASEGATGMEFEIANADKHTTDEIRVHGRILCEHLASTGRLPA